MSLEIIFQHFLATMGAVLAGDNNCSEIRQRFATVWASHSEYPLNLSAKRDQSTESNGNWESKGHDRQTIRRWPGKSGTKPRLKSVLKWSVSRHARKDDRKPNKENHKATLVVSVCRLCELIFVHSKKHRFWSVGDRAARF